MCQGLRLLKPQQGETIFIHFKVGEGEPQHEKDFQFLVAAALGVSFADMQSRFLGDELPRVFTPTGDNFLLRFLVLIPAKEFM